MNEKLGMPKVVCLSKLTIKQLKTVFILSLFGESDPTIVRKYA